MLVEHTTGNVGTARESFRIVGFYRPKSQSPELPIHEALKDIRSGIKHVSNEVFPSSAAQIRNMLWTTQRNDYPESSYLKFMVARTERGRAFGHNITQFILRIRGNAALRRITIQTPTGDHTTRPNIVIEGRFDILTEAEVLEHKMQFSAQGTNDAVTFDMTELNDIMYIEILSPKSRRIGRSNSGT